jgi:hypothetical protein
MYKYKYLKYKKKFLQLQYSQKAGSGEIYINNNMIVDNQLINNNMIVDNQLINNNMIVDNQLINNKIYQLFLKIKNNQKLIKDDLDILKNDSIFTTEPFNMTNATNIINQQCVCINTKKSEYYIHTYDIGSYKDKINNIFNILDNHEDNYIDYNIYNNCCNCFSYVLYAKNVTSICTLMKFLYNMMRSLMIINTELDICKFICKYYLDNSIFKVIKEILEDIQHTDYKYAVNALEYLNYLLLHEKSEIYIFICKDFNCCNENNENNENNLHNLQKFRSMRFMPLLDNDTNICIFRDADGFVSYTDCINIIKFIDNGMLFYIIDYTNTLWEPNTIYLNWWIRLYEVIKTHFINNYDIKKNNPFILLSAGCFATRIKINKEYIERCYTQIITNITTYLDKYINNDIINNTQIKIYKNKLYKNESNTLIIINSIKNILSIGFDEIFLNSLFENFTRTEDEYIHVYIDEYYLIQMIMSNPSNIYKIYVEPLLEYAKTNHLNIYNELVVITTNYKLSIYELYILDKIEKLFKDIPTPDIDRFIKDVLKIYPSSIIMNLSNSFFIPLISDNGNIDYGEYDKIYPPFLSFSRIID